MLSDDPKVTDEDMKATVAQIPTKYFADFMAMLTSNSSKMREGIVKLLNEQATTIHQEGEGGRSPELK